MLSREQAVVPSALASVNLPKVAIHDATGGYVQDHGSPNLESMLWLQLETTILKTVQIKRCVGKDCPNVFEVTGRSEQKYCSPECRSNNHSKKNYYKKREDEKVKQRALAWPRRRLCGFTIKRRE